MSCNIIFFLTQVFFGLLYEMAELMAKYLDLSLASERAKTVAYLEGYSDLSVCNSVLINTSLLTNLY